MLFVAFRKLNENAFQVPVQGRYAQRLEYFYSRA